MKLRKEIVCCPKCKREYTNVDLLSFSSFGGEDINPKTMESHYTKCEVCNIPLVSEFEIEYYDKDGNDTRKFSYKISHLFKKNK